MHVPTLQQSIGHQLAAVTWNINVLRSCLIAIVWLPRLLPKVASTAPSSSPNFTIQHLADLHSFVQYVRYTPISLKLNCSSISIAETMLNTGAFVLAALAPALYGHPADPMFAPAMIARDNTCSGLPQLCTDLVMLHGMATMLTYLCPKPTGLSTVHVTQTITTTVTASPIANPSGSYPTEVANEEPINSLETTTPTTIQSTITKHKTITVFHKDHSSKSSLPTPVITHPFSEGDPVSAASATPPAVTWSFSDVPPPQSSSNTTSSMLAPTAIYQNTTSQGGYAKPTISLRQEAKVSDSTVPFKGTAEHRSVSSAMLSLGLMIAATSL
ncbi:hypothetical protein T440DRAFT_477370 [Plenodomus tracheiphilus IPT5]|uniref:Uncharacterized protein n=1 Tax=Plenodomus tracheiphilus IPT5 TaxID=1408161 RepID=A0A6A7BCM3_9PLEO|nr:hypothetical protein T440DRAFT_477370 [Plenodomus tracheiphilus IPT5]